MPLLTILPNLQMGGSSTVAALSHAPLKYLSTEIDCGLGMTLLPTGNTLSISQVDTIPTIAPPGDKGVVYYINSGLLTIYVWDTDTNTWLN